MLGSPLRSPRPLINEVLDRVAWEAADTVVEYGPGVGDFTREILRRLRPDARLVAIETNQEFVRFLCGSMRDSRLNVAHGSAADVAEVLGRSGCRRADYVISGIPFSTMPAGAREVILHASRAVLRPEGIFLVYQYSRRMLPDLRRVFRRVHCDFRRLGILPFWLFHCVP